MFENYFTDRPVGLFILPQNTYFIMNQITIQKQQHSLAKKQVLREPAKKVSNLLSKKTIHCRRFDGFVVGVI